MKAATGELNLTVITLIAIAAVIGFFWIMWPNIQDSINSQWENISSDYDKSGYIVIEHNRWSCQFSNDCCIPCFSMWIFSF